MRQIILDTETTGLEPSQGHRLIEVGAVELVNRRFTGKNLHIYLNPEREVDPGALAVHGLNDAFLADKPKFQEIVAQLIAYIHGAELIIHNAKFDIGFLEHELTLVNHQVQKIASICQITDTLTMARQMHPGQKNSLDALCKRYRIDNSHRSLHGALLDAQILARVYLAMTGGQSSMLSDAFHAEPEVNQTAEKVENNTVDAIKADYPIHAANADELVEHEACLAMIQKKSKGQCVWLNEQ